MDGRDDGAGKEYSTPPLTLLPTIPVGQAGEPGRDQCRREHRDLGIDDGFGDFHLQLEHEPAVLSERDVLAVRLRFSWN